MEDTNWPRASAWLARADDSARILVVGVPSALASISGSRADLTPGALRSRLSRYSTFDSERAVDFGSVTVADLGDWPVSELAPAEMIPVVEGLAKSLPPSSLRLFIGGDNAITRPLARAAGGPTDTGVITFDAHHDVRNLTNGPSNGTPIRGLIEDGLPGANVAQVGIHSFSNSAEYRAYCDRLGISITTMADIDVVGISDATINALQALQVDRIHADFDIDVLDRSAAPGCPGSRPGGMTVRQLATAARIVAADPRVCSIDFVEVDPERDVAGLTMDALATVFLAAVTGMAERGSR